MTTHPKTSSEFPAPDRLTTLIDGVFAISLTLLILDLKLPFSNDNLARALIELIPKLLIYLFAFITIANQWIFHHRLFRFVRHVDGKLILLSFAYLLFLTLIPVNAAIVGGSSTDPLVAACFSADTLLLCLSSWAGMAYIGASPQLMLENADPKIFRKIARVWMYIGIGFAISLGLGFVSVYLAYLIWLVWPITAIWAVR